MKVQALVYPARIRLGGRAGSNYKPSFRVATAFQREHAKSKPKTGRFAQNADFSVNVLGCQVRRAPEIGPTEQLEQKVQVRRSYCPVTRPRKTLVPGFLLALENRLGNREPGFVSDPLL